MRFLGRFDLLQRLGTVLKLEPTQLREAPLTLSPYIQPVINLLDQAHVGLYVNRFTTTGITSALVWQVVLLTKVNQACLLKHIFVQVTAGDGVFNQIIVGQLDKVGGSARVDCSLQTFTAATQIMYHVDPPILLTRRETLLINVTTITTTSTVVVQMIGDEYEIPE